LCGVGGINLLGEAALVWMAGSSVFFPPLPQMILASDGNLENPPSANSTSYVS
jgi:hypothetical protein